MNHARPASLFFVILMALAGCSHDSAEQVAATHASQIMPAAGGPLLPLPGEAAPAHDPNDSLFMDVLSDWLNERKAPANTRYEFTRIDLDNDGRREGLVLMQSPHHEWCMEYGCTLFIFKAHDEGFSYLSEISPIRGPLIISEQRTNQWRDIIAHVSGRSGWDAKNVTLAFNGKSYPEQPAFEPAYSKNLLDIQGVKIFP